MNTENQPCGDPIVEENVQFLRQRSIVGQDKYGTKLTREDLTLGQWFDHAMEEAADLLNYLRRLKSCFPPEFLESKEFASQEDQCEDCLGTGVVRGFSAPEPADGPTPTKLCDCQEED